MNNYLIPYLSNRLHLNRFKVGKEAKNEKKKYNSFHIISDSQHEGQYSQQV